VASAPSAAAIAAYQRTLAEYSQARELFSVIDRAYWHSIAQKRAGRTSKRGHGETIVLDDYVLTQPPKYAGPPSITVVIFCWHICLISESMGHHDSEIMDDRGID
jgi:hypothetical protein